MELPQAFTLPLAIISLFVTLARRTLGVAENTSTGNQIISLNVGPGLYMLRVFSDEILKATEQIIIIK